MSVMDTVREPGEREMVREKEGERRERERETEGEQFSEIERNVQKESEKYRGKCWEMEEKERG